MYLASNDLGLSEEPRNSPEECSWGITARGRADIGSFARLEALSFEGDLRDFSLDIYPQSPIFIFLHLSCSQNEHYLAHLINQISSTVQTQFKLKVSQKSENQGISM